MRIKIISKGTPESTHVVNADTGERLENVASVGWVDGKAQVIIHRVTVDVVAEAEVEAAEIEAVTQDDPAEPSEQQ